MPIDILPKRKNPAGLSPRGQFRAKLIALLSLFFYPSRTYVFSNPSDSSLHYLEGD